MARKQRKAAETAEKPARTMANDPYRCRPLRRDRSLRDVCDPLCLPADTEPTAGNRQAVQSIGGAYPGEYPAPPRSVSGGRHCPPFNRPTRLPPGPAATQQPPGRRVLDQGRHHDGGQPDDSRSHGFRLAGARGRREILRDHRFHQGPRLRGGSAEPEEKASGRQGSPAGLQKGKQARGGHPSLRSGDVDYDKTALGGLRAGMGQAEKTRPGEQRKTQRRRFDYHCGREPGCLRL